MTGTTIDPEGTGGTEGAPADLPVQPAPGAESADEGALEVAKAFAEFARDLLAHDSVQSTLEEITALAVSEIDGCDFAGVSLVEKRRRISTHAATDPLVEQIDGIQYSTGEGPCIEAVWVREVFSVDSVEEETRWPRFTDQALRLGVGSMCSFQLFTHNDILGGLNLYSTQPRAFGVDAYEIGWILAAHAAVALANVRAHDNLQQAVRTRQRIGEATGILVERYKITDRQAFSLLAKASQNLNVKLITLAEELVHTGSFPAGDS
ncbi:GAF and ANTAR domain-containing protein [Streptomonospora litoralis]|uniref:ANTAR domain protein n=1 Tax=Streptomonospora litoralis TaxID=2498135 RepID=A0A4P6Q9F2_9ACTN|nr:GAF and ANTAR domain-containing protein [Streptomonospora litoralis]QBI55874.1 ANTAR domain protein [Streptomonospora litoralis]